MPSRAERGEHSALCDGGPAREPVGRVGVTSSRYRFRYRFRRPAAPLHLLYKVTKKSAHNQAQTHLLSADNKKNHSPLKDSFCSLP